jgi:Bacterial PH domain
MIERRVYRAPRLTRVLSWIFVLAFFLGGVVTATGSPRDPGKGGTIGAVLGVAVGVCVILLSLGVGAVVATSSLIVTSAGLTYRNKLRRRLITWAEIESFTVGPGRGRGRWPTLVVCLNDGSKVVTNVASFTAGHPAQVARELTALQTSPAAPPPTL